MIALLCILSSPAQAASPASATLNPNATQPVSWLGEATGPASTNSPTTCQEGIDCDTFLLTIGGSASDWVGKVARIKIDWSQPTSDFDLYVLRETTSGTFVVAQSVHNLSNSQERFERVTLHPDVTGTGQFLVRVIYTAAAFSDQYRAVAGVNNLFGAHGINGKIAFTRQVIYSTDRRIYVIRPDGSNLQQLTPSSTESFRPTWSPDGIRIAFFGNRDSNLSYNIYLMNYDGSEQKRLTPFPAAEDAPAWSPDGSRIAFVGREANSSEIYVMNADGSELKQLTYNIYTETTPVWSPDGSKIAFCRLTDLLPGSYARHLYVMDADGGNQTQLTFTQYGILDPVWSPDGTKIAFVSFQNGQYDIFTINADGSNQMRLTNTQSVENYLAWSPDGSKIAYADVNVNQVYVMDADGTNLTQLTNVTGVNYFPVWSPDGTKIAFLNGNTSNGLTEVYVMDADGANQTQLTFLQSVIYDLSWQGL